MTPEQYKLARHALGLDNPRAAGMSYRNRYFVTVGGRIEDEWKAMEAAGEAEFRMSSSSQRLYALTRTGAELALKPGEILDPEDFP